MAKIISPARTALYYPYPFVQDEAWLKSAMLFWDSIHRIVPRRFSEMHGKDALVTKLSPEIQEMNNSLGFIKDYELEPHGYWGSRKAEEATARAASGLLELMDTAPQLFLESRGSSEGYFSWGNMEYTKLFWDTVGPLAQRDAFLEYDGPFGKRFRFRNLPGRVYMALLAKEIGEIEGIPVVTDNEAHDAILRTDALSSQSRYKNVIFQGSDDATTFSPPPNMTGCDVGLCTLTFKTIGVTDLRKQPISKILTFREKYDSERRAFADEIQNIVTELHNSGVSDSERLRAHLSERVRDLDKAARDYSQAAKGMGLQTASRMLRASFSLPIAELVAEHLALTGAVSMVIAGVTGVVSIGTELHKSHLDRVKARLANPSAFYLHKLSRKFG